jgi:hypothetical protein
MKNKQVEITYLTKVNLKIVILRENLINLSHFYTTYQKERRKNVTKHQKQLHQQ